MRSWGRVVEALGSSTIARIYFDLFDRARPPEELISVNSRASRRTGPAERASNAEMALPGAVK